MKRVVFLLEEYSMKVLLEGFDSVARLLTAVSAPQTDELERMRMELLRVRFDEQLRTERRKTPTAIESQASGSLKPWREVVTPHRDVASGRYQQAEFAADLWQVRIGDGAAAGLVATLGSKAEVAREFACRLYTLCERRKRAPEAFAYNALVQSFPETTRLAHEGTAHAPEQQTLGFEP